MKKKLAIAVAVLVGLGALVPTIAFAAGDISICDIECSSLDCYVAQLFTC